MVSLFLQPQLPELLSLPTPLVGMVGQVSSAFFPPHLCYVSVLPFHSRSDLVIFIKAEKFMFTTSLYLESAL